MSYISAAQAKQIAQKIKEILDTKADVTGIYDDFIAGLAKNLLSKVSQQNVDAYIYRTSGGSHEIGDTCQVKSIVGGSLGFNQLVRNGNFADTSGWLIVGNPSTGTLAASGNILTWTKGNGGTGIIQSSFSKTLGHRYLVSAYVKPSVTAAGGLLMTGGGINDYFAYSRRMTADVWNVFAGIITATATGTGSFYVYGDITGTQEEGYTCQFANVMVTDLDADFGSDIANYVYNLETTTAGAGVAWFRKYFPKPYYPNTPIGGFTHVKTRGKKVVGFNQFDLDDFVKTYPSQCSMQDGVLDIVTDAPLFSEGIPVNILADQTSGAHITCEGKLGTALNARVRIVYEDDSNTEISFTSTSWTKAEANLSVKRIVAIRLNWSAGGTFSLRNLCINFHYDGERDGEYEPYEEKTYPCDLIELIGIPHIDEQGNLYFEGNRYNSDGTVDEEYDIVDLGTLNWTEYGSGDDFTRYITGGLDDKAKSSGYSICTVLDCARGIFNPTPGTLTIGSGSNAKVSVATRKNQYESGSAFKAAMSGFYLIYQKAAVTRSTATSFTEIQRVWNWGTEQHLPPENDTRPVEVPVGHDTDYLLDIRSKVEIMPDLPTNDGQYVVDVTSGTSQYIPLATWLQTNGYKPSVIPDPPNADGTYDLTLTIADGAPTYSWVART